MWCGVIVAVVQQQWGDYLGWNGATVTLPYGLSDTRPTTIQLPALHYPGPKLGLVNKTLIDELWHATGCPNPTPDWGYNYWSSQAEMGTGDMMTYLLLVVSLGGLNFPPLNRLILRAAA
jgi:hypothetical protein